jgi:hypothetical protein
MVSTARGLPWSRAMRAVQFRPEGRKTSQSTIIPSLADSSKYIKHSVDCQLNLPVSFPFFENCRQQKTVRTADSRIIELVERLVLVIIRSGKLEKGFEINENREK